MDTLADQWSPINNVCTLLTSIQVCPAGLGMTLLLTLVHSHC